MLAKERDELLREVHQAVIGIKDNPDENGLIGDVKEINKKLDIVNGRTRRNETRSKINRWAIGSLFGGGGLGGIGKFLGWF